VPRTSDLIFFLNFGALLKFTLHYIRPLASATAAPAAASDAAAAAAAVCKQGDGL